MKVHDISPIDLLILLWLLPRPKGEGSRANLKAALEGLVSHRLSPGEWASELDQRLGSLEKDDLVRRVRTTGVALTDSGRREAFRALGVEALPSKTTWTSIRETYLIARALELEPTSAAAVKRLAGADGLRAAILQTHFDLAPGEPLTLSRALEGVAWKQLGEPTGQPFTKNAVLTLLLNRALAGAKPLGLEKVKQQLPAKLAGARRSDAGEIRRAILRKWLDTDAAPRAPQADSSGTSDEPLNAFAARISRAARSLKKGRFGDNKVFIAHVWDALGGSGLSLDNFKRRLIDAHRANLLVLSRADLVEAMDPNDVAASEARYLNATFHFIRTDV